VLPVIFLGHRLAFSTEAVVLDDRSLGSAFQHSFKLSAGRFERWLEMIVVSVLIVLSALFVVAALSLVVPGVGWSTWVIAGWMLVAAIWPVIQYAWTFFYLRLVESEEPAGVEVGPMYATPAPAPSSWTPPSTAPSHLALVEPRRTPPPEEDRTA
jgi:hypothetical protein